MKSHISALLLALAVLTSPAAGEERPHFKNLADFLAWADKRLADDDYPALIAAQADSAEPRETKLAYIRKLDTDLGSKKLRKIFEGRAFPSGEANFKLGGHMKELGHCHIDFSKKDGLWQIDRIWQCR